MNYCQDIATPEKSYGRSVVGCQTNLTVSVECQLKFLLYLTMQWEKLKCGSYCVWSNPIVLLKC